MENIKKIGQKYFDVLKERSKKSRVYKAHQLTGLALAEILQDLKYTSLYMKLAKNYDNEELLRLAKTVAERKDIAKKGAYFMKIMKESKIQKISKA